MTIPVQIEAAVSGAYELTPEPGVLAISPRSGTAPAGILPLTFVLGDSLPAGRQRIATLTLVRGALPVWYAVPERRGLFLSQPIDVRVRSGRNLVSAGVSNRGNVEQRVRVRALSQTLRIKSAQDTIVLAAGATVHLMLDVTVPAPVAAGSTHEVTVEVTPRQGSASRMVIRLQVAGSRVGIPLEIGAWFGSTHPAVSWISADGWFSDSIRIRAAYGSRIPGWLESAGSRNRILKVTAPLWRLSAGEIDLPRASDLSPWLNGTGIRAEVGRITRWTAAATWMHAPGATAAQVSTRVRLPAINLEAAVLHLSRPDGAYTFPTIAVSAGRARAFADAAGGLLLSGGSATAVGSGNGRFAVGPLRLTTAVSRSALPGGEGPTLAFETLANAALDLRTSSLSSLFTSFAVNRSLLDSAGDATALTSSASLKAGARFRRGGIRVVPAAEVRTLVRNDSSEVTVRAATITASSSIGRTLSFRGEGGWSGVTSGAQVFSRSTISARLDWIGRAGFLGVAAAYGDAPTAPTLRPGLFSGQLSAGLRTAPANLDLNFSIARGRAHEPSNLYGTAMTSLHVGRRTDLLIAARRAPSFALTDRWTLSLGLRSALVHLPGIQADQRSTLFEDTNGNGRRDAGERGLAGVPLSSGDWSSLTDADGRFHSPALRAVVPDLRLLGDGWQVAAVTPHGIAVMRTGSVTARAVFAPSEVPLVESIPRGVVVLVGAGAESMPGELDSAGFVRWTGLRPGTYFLYHLAPGTPLPASKPPSSVAVRVAAGANAALSVLSSYQPRRILLRHLGGEALRTGAETPSARDRPPPGGETPRARATDPAPPGAPQRLTCPAPASGLVRPGMSGAAVACALGPADRVTRRGAWEYWFYGRPARIAQVTYHDIVFFRRGRVVTAILLAPRRAYEGPPPHQQIVEELRGSER